KYLYKCKSNWLQCMHVFDFIYCAEVSFLPTWRRKNLAKHLRSGSRRNTNDKQKHSLRLCRNIHECLYFIFSIKSFYKMSFFIRSKSTNEKYVLQGAEIEV